MQMLPFYTLVRHAGSVAVWHDNEACSVGQGIALRDRRPGQDHLRAHCQQCVHLNQPVGLVPHRAGSYSDILAGVSASKPGA